MASEQTRLIEAAGGALWRPNADGTGIELGVIHRPKYDDWSLPKGKIKSSEHPLLGAVREVEEETGFTVTVGRPIGEIRYDKDGAPKRVRYWAMRARDGAFVPNDEVDELAWLTPEDAAQRLLPERDLDILAALLDGPISTFPVLLVRHGSAGERGSAGKDDRRRGLDERGERQAERLTRLLDLYGIADVRSADLDRCTQTVSPYAAAQDLPVQIEPLFSEEALAADPDAAADRLIELSVSAVPTAISSQGKAIPALVDGICDRLGVEPAEPVTVRKGGLCVLHFDDEIDELELVDIDRIDPPT